MPRAASAGVQRFAVDPIRTVIQHVNVQVAELDDMVAAHERVTAEGFKMMWSVGQHPNDRELSFYVQTPSGFEIELGWNPIVVDAQAEAGWTTGHYQGISLWGHFPEGLTLAAKLGQMGRGLASLTRQEHTVGVRG